MINPQITALESQDSIFSISLDIAKLLNLKQAPVETTVEQNVNPASLAALTRYRNFLIHAIVEKEIQPENDVDMFKNFLDFYSLSAPFDVEKYIQNGDIVEVYGEDFVQIYRNKTFFNFCSYDIYTVLSHPFNVLFRRDDNITQQILKRAQECILNATGIERVGVEKNFMQEHYARNDKVFEIEHKWCSPIHSTVTGKTMGLFCSQKAHFHGNSNVKGIGFIAH